MSNYQNYHEIRFHRDPRRSVLWRVLTKEIFQSYVPLDGSVMELGAGYCDFINNIQAKTKYAIDTWEGVVDSALPGINVRVGDFRQFEFVADDSLDLIFCSNLFEHVTKEALAECLSLSLSKLKVSGRLIALQPNYRYAYARYFDDYTHISIWSDVSLSDFFAANGFEIERVIPRFLPLTLKSSLPVHPLLIKAYLLSPIKPMGRQMLVVAQRAA